MLTLRYEIISFTINSSTKQAKTTTIYDKFLDNLYNKQYTCAIFFDIEKVFDRSVVLNMWYAKLFLVVRETFIRFV